MGTQDFPLHLPNHETTLNAKPILVFAPQVSRNVVKSATLECRRASSQIVQQYAHYTSRCSHLMNDAQSYVFVRALDAVKGP
jgi:hypothetical protein